MGNNYSGKMTLNASPFREELKKLESSLKIAKNSFKEVQASSLNWKNSTEELSNVLKAQSDVVKLAKDKLEMLNKQYEWLKNSGNPSEASLRKLNEQISSQKKEVALASANLKSYQDIALDTAKNNLNLSESFSSLKLALTELSVEIAKKATSALVDFTKETVNAGLQFETAFAGVKKVVDGTEEDFASLQAEIRKTATEKPISADTLASLYQAGAQLGIQKENLKDFTNAIIDLQNTSDLTAEAGATMIAQYANVMKLPSEDYERFASTLSYLGSTTATTESRIMSMAQRISGAGSSIGMTHQGVLALATALGSVGIEAEMGGSAISTIMLNIEKAVAKSSDQLHVWADTAGMTAQEFSNLWKIDVTGAIQAVLKGLSDEKAGGESLILTLEELGIKNIRQTQTMLQLSSASDMLTETINKANQEWQNNTFLAESSNRVYETTANQMTLLQNSFKEVQLSIYDDLAKPLQDVTKDLTEFLKSEEVAKFSKEFSESLVNLGKTATAIIKSLITNFDKVVIVVKTIATTIASLFVTSMVTKATTTILNIINAFKKLQTVITATANAQKVLNIVMNSNVFGMLITGVGLLVTALLDLNIVLGSTKDGLSDIERQIIENNDARDKEIAGIESEYNHYEDLVKELKTLVDENGNVKEGYEDRVNAIIPLLQNATGEEITLINNQIQGYDNLITKLDEVIAKKRAEAKMSAYEGDYKEALKNEEELAKKKKELEERIAKDKAKDDGSIGLKADSTGVSYARQDLALAEKELKDINAQLDNGTEIINKYETMLADYTKTYTNSIKKTNEEANNVINGFSNTDSASTTGSSKTRTTSKSSKVKEKTENELLKEGNYTYAELNKLTEKYKNDLKVYTEEMKNGNAAVTVAMVEETKKNLDTVENKLKTMKELLGTTPTNIMSTKDDTTEAEIENLHSTGIIYGPGVLDEKAIEDTATQKAQMEAEAYRQAELAIQEERNLADANQDALNNQLAILDPSNLEIYDTTQRLLAEQEQTSHSQGLNDNAYKVVDAELSTLNQAKQMALTIDFTSIGLYICQSIANGINANRGLVIDAVRSMMAEANSMAEDTEEEESPSKVFKRIGRYMDEGLEIGIKDNSDGVISNVKEMMTKANEVAKTNLSGLGTNVSSTIRSANEALYANNNKTAAGANQNIINYNFTQNNTSNKSLDTLAIYKESRSLLKREVRDIYV